MVERKGECLMIVADVEKVMKIFLTVDGGCSSCCSDAIRSFMEEFPEFSLEELWEFIKHNRFVYHNFEQFKECIID